MTIKTKTGKEFTCRPPLADVSLQRMYIAISGSNLHECAVIFTDPAELPVDGYPEFVKCQSVADGGDYINVALKY